MSTIDEINELISQYSFPLAVLEDVNHRLECCKDEGYVKQQLRYLKNLVSSGIGVKEK